LSIAERLNRIDDLLEAEQDPRLGFVLSLGAPIASIDDDVVRVDAFSAPVDSTSRLGGDWVDAFRTIDGRLVISVGDVMGSGLGAAGAMLAARQALRGVALIDADPGVILLAVDRVLRMQHPELFCSAFVAVVDPVTQRASYANAGHPLPYLWFPDRSIRQLRGRALPLGIDPQPAYPVEHTDVPPGCAFILYTDGLVEWKHDAIAGEAALEQALTGLAIDEEESPAQTIRYAVAPPIIRDDIAVMVARLKPVTPVRRWRFDPMWQDAARRVRTELADELRKVGIGEAVAFDAELVLPELIGNAIHHAPGTIEVVLDHRGDVVLHVLDKGPGFHFHPRLPHDLYSETGRGIYLISRLAREFTVQRRPGGGTHARVVLARSKGYRT